MMKFGSVPKWMRQVGWFVLLWVASVLTLVLVAYPIRMVLQP